MFNNPVYSYHHHIQYDIVPEFIGLSNDTKSLIDIGTGRGQLLKNISKLNPNFKITSVDLDKFNDLDVEFINVDLSLKNDRDKLTGKYDFLTSTDVLEHLEEYFIEDVLCLFSRLSDNVIVAIANHSDIQGGIELHTIQRDDVWWELYINKYFSIINKQTHYDGRLYIYNLKTLV